MPSPRRPVLAAPALLVAALAALTAPAAAELDAPTRARLDELFAPWNDPEKPGVAAGLVRGEELVWARGYGSANLDHRVPLGPRSVFYLASVSKQFAAAAIALLVLDGELRLDDPVRAHFPELPEDVYGAVTVDHLVHHTSGIRDYLSLMGFEQRSYEDHFTNDDAIALLARQRGLNFPPGSRHLYSNSNYVLLAELVPRVTGKSSQELAEERLFGPLGMTATHWGVDPHRVLPGRVTSYAGNGEERPRRRFVHNFTGHGDGNLWSTVEDLARWLANLGTRRVGGEALFDLITTRGALADGAAVDYAFGLAHETFRGRPALAHGGGFLGFRTYTLWLPGERLGVVILANDAGVDSGKLAEGVAALALALPLEEEPEPEPEARIAIPPAILEAAVGEYHEPGFGVLVRLELVDGRLQLRRPFGDPVPLHARGATHFTNQAQQLLVTLGRLEDGGADGPVVRAVQIRAGSNPAQTYRRTAPRPLTPEEIAALAGAWESDELDRVLRLEAGEEGALQLAGGDPLRFLGEGRFHAGPFGLELERDDQGAPLALRLVSGRASGMRFVRR